LTLEGLAGSLLWVGFPGATPEEVPLAALRDLAPGGLVLFGRNVTAPEATARLVEAVRGALARGAGGPPPVAIDQEGGRVARLQRGFAAFPSALALGACADAGLAHAFGSGLATEIRRAGAGVDFAPVLDLLLDPGSTVIGTRALGDEPQAVAPLGAAMVRGLQGGGVAAVVKHFPGHGASAVDSHLALPRIEASPDELRARELVPFAAAFEAGALGVMAGHLLVPSFDPERPASLSRRTLDDVLREQLGFRGLCFTDCLLMEAIARRPGGSVAAAVDALEAGADALVISHDLETARAARDAIVAAVRSGRIPLARLEEARARAAAFASALDASAARAASESDPAAVARRVAAGAVTLVRGRAALDATRIVNVIAFEGDASDGIGSRVERTPLHVLLRERRVRAESLRLPLEPTAGDLETLDDVLSTQRERQLVIVARRAHLFPAQAAAIDALLVASPDAVLVAALEPFDVERFPEARSVLCTYGDDATTFEALAEILSGRAEARGRMPVRLRA
jgi:beta-N-acetylhexosaminidase